MICERIDSPNGITRIRPFELARSYYNMLKNDIRWILVRRDGPVCSQYFGHGCGKWFPLDDLTIDHVVPTSKGGRKLDLDNMQLLCPQCHSEKDDEITVKFKSIPETRGDALRNISKNGSQMKGLHPKKYSILIPNLVKLCYLNPAPKARHQPGMLPTGFVQQ